VISRVYARLLEARARRYASGKAVTHRLEHPVISVGNITMGGAGKTPFVAHLARRLKFEGKRPAILSRGYGRTSRGVVLVSEGNGPLVTPDVGGDEPVALAMRLPGVIVAVGERRVEAARAAQSAGADVFLLDDGYQHLSVGRDANLLLLDARDPFGGGRFPPRGRLREPLSALARADAFVFTRTEPGTPTAEVAATLRRWNDRAPIFTARLRASGLYDESGAPVEAASLGQRRAIAVCAVANPASFAATLSEVGLTPEQIVSYRDHHRYSARDFARIERIASASGASWIVTTEKDAVKFGSGLTLPTITLRLSVEVGESGFFPFLASRISGTPRAAARAGR
jgi:tetraacyldisaccharide 4'-kinase